MTDKNIDLDTYNNRPEGMPRVKRMSDSTIDWVINGVDTSGMFLDEAGHRKLHNVCHAVAEEVLARLPGWPSQPSAEPAPAAPAVAEVLREICDMQEKHYGYGMDTHLALIGLAEKGRKALAAQPAAAPLNSVSEQDAKDAARYRWLSKSRATIHYHGKRWQHVGVQIGLLAEYETHESLDAAIDVAMTATPSSQKGTADE